MNQLDAIQIYLRVAELASFTEAADSLGIAKANVSSAVQQLESMLGTRLLHRTTRRVQMTHDGQAFYERSKDLLADFDELKTLFNNQQNQLSGRLRVDMPTAMARGLVIPALPQFLREHPHLEIELSSTDRRVDVVREGFDCVVRVGNLLDSSLVARPIGEYQLINCVSPSYIETYGVPQTLEDLARHKLVHYVSVLGGKSYGFEYVDPLTSVTQYIDMEGALIVNNAEAYLSACLAGLGIIQIPENGATAKPYLQSGQLIEVLPDYRSAPMPVSLIYANRRHLPKRVQAFMNWMIEILKPSVSSAN
ncbi:transcriptional regulator [Cellvibrio zantedeschiae]|uniref:Transcriptional regulator n=1 Tax=Cellvibrio zantedeschiae TaxID=1237077 RepID=A0ABQ3AS69_9GAMM|nr:LysR family transcriptional regulator [Cellvibrio zantedeschiae]GGY62314.1 transcriptional regulator [Cellvibrio zantedeschiae]